MSARSLHVGQAIRESVNGRAVVSAGVPHCSPHTCRRALASWALEAGMDLDTLPRLMGHANFTVLQRYLDRTPGQRRHPPVNVPAWPLKPPIFG